MLARQDFPEGKQPAITEQQVRWLLHRMSVQDDLHACRLLKIDHKRLQGWLRHDPDFQQVYLMCQENKREAFKYLGTQLLPKITLVLLDLLDENSVTARVRAAELFLRSQALLIDRQERTDPDAIQDLIKALRTPRPLLSISPPEEAQDA